MTWKPKHNEITIQTTEDDADRLVNAMMDNRVMDVTIRCLATERVEERNGLDFIHTITLRPLKGHAIEVKVVPEDA